MRTLLFALTLLLLTHFAFGAAGARPGMFHGDIAIGGMPVSANDLNKDFKSPFYTPKFNDTFSLMVSGQAGYLLPMGLYFDLGFDVGPMRTITNKDSGGSGSFAYTIDEKIDFTQYRVTAIPGFLLPVTPKVLLSAQLGLGYSMVNAVYTSTYKSTFFNSNVGYSLRGSTFDYVPELRVQYLVTSRLSAGLGVGWNGSRYSSIEACCGTGGINTSNAPKPLKNNSGSDNFIIDHSGPFAKLVITTYFKDFAEVAAPAAAVIAPATVASAVDPLGDGDRAYQQRNYLHAEGNYMLAVQNDPYNARAWQGLGNAYWAQRRPSDAYVAYRQALALDPNNAELKKIVASAPAK